MLIDDLVTRGVDEPYRMFTSRAEYRLSLRQDNADRRLTPLGRDVGLVDSPRWERFAWKVEEIARVTDLLKKTRTTDGSLLKLMRRPETNWNQLSERLPELAAVSADVARQVEYDVKYEGYVARQEQEIDRNRRLAERRIPDSFDYARISQLRVEAREKLGRIRPLSIAQASRISGITPADLALLMVHLDG